MTSQVSRTLRPARPRATTVVARAMWALATVFLVIGIVTPGSGGPIDVGSAIVTAVVLLMATLPAVTAGTILVTRLPSNLVGWLLLIAGLAIAVTTAVSNLAGYGLNVHPGSVPGAVWFAIISDFSWLPVIACALVYLPLLYPTGRLLSPRWRIVTVAATGGFLVATIESAVAPFTPGTYPPDVRNPLLLSGPLGDLLAGLGNASHVVVIATVFLALASLVVRYRRAAGVERQQLKWFAVVIAIGGPATVIALLTSNITTGIGADISSLSFITAVIGLALLPVAVGIAVLRYRLYEIDRLISRTISYGVLTAIVGGLFVGFILVFQAVLAPVTGSNELAVAGSTLLAAALFQPIRRRVQRIVDRRFNRSRYDAERTVAAFAERLRDEVDLEQLRAEILATVSAAVEPSSASLWLRE
jgi:hypothetical protein